MGTQDIAFGCQAAPASDVAKPDRVPNREVMEKEMTRFADKMCPRYSVAMRKKRAA